MSWLGYVYKSPCVTEEITVRNLKRQVRIGEFSIFIDIADVDDLCAFSLL